MTDGSILFVCVGNTCRSPMAEGLAKKFWPHLRIESAATQLFDEMGGAAELAIEVMHDLGIDIRPHSARFVGDLQLEEFSLFVALGSKPFRQLRDQFGVPEQKIVKLFVADPFDGGRRVDYEECARSIEAQLVASRLSKTSGTTAKH